jgi:hypothetical protein
MYLLVDKLQGDIQIWLSPPDRPDPWKNYNIACRSRHTGTVRWFLESNSLSKWKSTGLSSLLWVHGKCAWSSSLYAFTVTDGFPGL